MKLPRRVFRKPIPVEEMTLIDHLKELRRRLMWSMLAVVIGAIVVYIFKTPIYEQLEAPYCGFQAEQAPEQPCEFLITGPLESFSIVLKLSGYGGMILALPVVMYHIARFVMPALYPKERRVVIPFVAASIVLMLGGMTAGYFMTEKALIVLNGFGFDSFVPRFTPTEYVSFFVKMLLGFGVAAELPLVIVFLLKVGLVSAETLRKNRRLALVGIVVLGAFVTPTGDPFTLSIVSVPMYLSYELAIIIGSRIAPKKSLASKLGLKNN